MSSPELAKDITSLPLFIWHLYVQYLWRYQPGSWVARIAYTFRILAFLLILPIVILTLLDLTSYVIARTLGVIDDVKASTSDKMTPMQDLHTPSILISTPLSESTPDDIAINGFPEDQHRTPSANNNSLPPPSNASQPQAYFASEEHNLKLSGVDVFSPATSQPPSPTISRRNLSMKGINALDSDSQDDAVHMRQRKPRVEGIAE